MINKSQLTFTLAQIREQSPCEEGWRKLLRGLGYANGKYNPAYKVSIADVARINDAADALWCLRCVDLADADLRRTVIRCVILPAAQRAAKHTTDNCIHACLDKLAQWADGDDSVNLTAVISDAYAVAVANTADAAYAADAADAAAHATSHTARTATNTNSAAAAVCAAYAAAWAAYAAEAAAAHAARVAERNAQSRDILKMYEMAAE